MGKTQLTSEAPRFSTEIALDPGASFAFAVEKMPVPVLLFRALSEERGVALDYEFVAINPAAESAFGIAPSEFVGRSLRHAYPTAGQHILELFAQVVATEQAVRFGGMRFGAGSIVDATAFRPAIGLIGVLVQDASHQHQTRQGLTVDLALMDKSEDFTHSGSFDWDLRTNTITASRGMHRLMGIAPGHFDGRIESIYALVHPEDRATVEKHANAALRQGVGPSQPVEFRICRGAETRHVWVQGEVIRNEAGEAVRGIGAGQDITERKSLEERLYQSEKMDAIGRLAGGIAHDFNNMLGPILGYADLLVGQIEDTELRRFAENISRSARRAADLTTQLLGFARKSTCEMKTVDIHEALEELVVLLEQSVDRRITIEQEQKSPHAVVMGDRTQLHNVLLNLALNARDAMPDGGTLRFVTDVVSCDEAQCRALSPSMTPGKYVAISVMDTGVGMTAPILKRMFEPFFTTKPKGKGTGMGLASAYATVRNHGGALRVTSMPGQGSTFTVYLPSGTPIAQETSTTQDNVPEARAAVHVMVVNDEDSVRSAIADVLQMLGYRVTACKTPADAVRALRAKPADFDVVFLDTSTSGFHITDTLHALRSTASKSKILISSAYGISNADMKDATTSIDGVVDKPYTANQLAKQIQAAITR